MANIVEVMAWYDKQIFNRIVYDTDPERMFMTEVNYTDDKFSWPCSTPSEVPYLFELVRRVAHEQEAGVESFAIAFDGGLPSRGLVRKIKDELTKVDSIGEDSAHKLRFGYLPIQGSQGPLGCVAYLQNIKNYI